MPKLRSEKLATRRALRSAAPEGTTEEDDTAGPAVEVTDAVISAAELGAAAAAAAGEAGEADGVPDYPALSAKDMAGGKVQFRRVPVPPHRLTPLREAWLKIFNPVVEHMKLQIRMNTKTRHVELRTCDETEDSGALQKSADFVKAFMLGFAVEDAIALLRLDNLYLDTFEVKDVKPLHGDHLSRAIGRVAGKAGKTKFTIENATKTRVVLADSKIHILGEYQNIRMARHALANLIMGSPPGKVYGKLHTVAARVNERY
mmetsp:Transcript_4596/g.11799  ORF Transcript_4596/g.11799 Transcript_4596/m.11799 type:complete len:259 (+) Transcript_4596:132-908(+)|eukprot:CAMPEP_0182916520 /NCGR_PEP_ID=MMETSP0105_2-20130417/993_1 /TAXON_ID=81532 ORGANISM="Acanthoeca-like sp., Strain 10tr" /NCGR_SAMPLE_ID=MMETSP0105_2 /ASSEMBLY_ACC=CAM_ASM_000205 /LENGTH=258 /DNA_ID=CAMNT_0025053479 /DNA_START=64 /DNA_END=840 /DNA_ORIENTATION=+